MKLNNISVDEDTDIGYLVLVGIGLCLLIFGYVVFASPYINIWQQRMLGQAELARAESNRKITICEAQSRKESANSLAEAEVIRAQGVAKANKIIGDSLENNEGYLRYLYITHLSEATDKTVIYIPTEATLPILESYRLNQKK